jgi:hypothetical protein
VWTPEAGRLVCHGQGVGDRVLREPISGQLLVKIVKPRDKMRPGVVGGGCAGNAPVIGAAACAGFQRVLGDQRRYATPTTASKIGTNGP